MEQKEPQKIEIVNGDGKDLKELDISPVYNHIDIEKPKEEQDKKKIIIPEEKK